MSIAAQCFFNRDRMLCLDNLVWKCWICSVGGYSAGEAICVMVGRRREYCFKIVESVFVFVSNRFVMDGCNRVGSRSMLGLNPFVAYRIAEVIVMMKSGAARWLG